jgi:aspartate racemase
MKKIGIVGGVAWQSTAEYYSQICRLSEQWRCVRRPNGIASMPEMTIESLDIDRARSYLGYDQDERSWSQFDDYHRAALNRLEASGADFAIIASITAHHRLDAICRGVEIPVISVVEEVAMESKSLGLRHLLLLGTEATMKSAKFREQMARHGIQGTGPQDDIVRKQTIKLIADLQQGKSAGADKRLVNIAKLSLGSKFGGRSAVCLACTELSLAFARLKQRITFEKDGILYINASAVHIRAAFSRALDH